jgi:excisionase family DNA binding protein
MTMNFSATSLSQVLDSMDRKTVLECLREAQHRIDFYEVVQSLLQARLVRMTTEPDALLTISEVAKRLQLGLPRTYELVRQKALPAVKIGERQVRVRRSDLDHYLRAHLSQKTHNSGT